MYKLFYIFLFIILFCCEAKTQTNLVYNGDFELYDTCPTVTTYPGNPQIEHCLGWYAPTYATPDYFNSCAISIVGTPINTFGFQYPFSGNAYCGVFIQNCIQPSCDGWWIEYIQSKLVSPLIAGNNYEFSFKIVMSDLGFDYAFSRLGAYFTNSKITKITNKPFTGIVPQVLNTTNNYLLDTLNWVNIKGEFIAQGGEEYVTIGYFPDTLKLDTLAINIIPIEPTNYGNYYFIDDVKLFEKPCINIIPNVFTPNKDGINDLLKINPCIPTEKTIIFNRWGNKVFETTEVNHYWDGTNNSDEECAVGYYYIIIETKEKNIKGFVQLIR